MSADDSSNRLSTTTMQHITSMAEALEAQHEDENTVKLRHALAQRNESVRVWTRDLATMVLLHESVNRVSEHTLGATQLHRNIWSTIVAICQHMTEKCKVSLPNEVKAIISQPARNIVHLEVDVVADIRPLYEELRGLGTNSGHWINFFLNPMKMQIARQIEAVRTERINTFLADRQCLNAMCDTAKTLSIHIGPSIVNQILNGIDVLVDKIYSLTYVAELYHVSEQEEDAMLATLND